MIKLGIDIVDLSDPQLQKRGERALKLISHPEDQLIDHHYIYWLLWAAKETTFKCYREDTDFMPKKIPITLSVLPSNEIVFISGVIEGVIEVNHDFVMAVGSNQLSDIEYHTLHSNSIEDSSSVRKSMMDYFKAKNREISIGVDTLGLPILEPENYPVSISHHYHKSAFAYPKSIP